MYNVLICTHPSFEQRTNNVSPVTAKLVRLYFIEVIKTIGLPSKRGVYFVCSRAWLINNIIRSLE